METIRGESSMKFMTSWTLPTGDAYRTVVAQFLKTGGAAPDGMTIITRWHGANGKGFLVAECDDEKVIGKWIAEWREFLDIQATVVLDDAAMAPILQSLFA
jgi:hypothetical protein